MQSDDYDSLFKVLLIGEPSVGKTCLMKRFVDREFTDSYKTTIGVDFSTRTLTADLNGVSRLIKLQIWDTAGQERFAPITSANYRGTHAALIVFSLADVTTFDSLSKWMARLDDYSIGLRILIGSKSDLEPHMVTDAQIANFCEHNAGIQYVETSALSGINVEQVFQTTAQQLTEMLAQGKLTDATDKKPIMLPPSNVGEETMTRKGCCGGNG